MSGPNFISEFESGMAKLNATHQRVEATLAQRAEFSKTLLTELTSIKAKIDALNGKISGLKQTITDMRDRFAANAAAIAEKEQQIQNLQRENGREVQQLKAQIDGFQKDNQFLSEKIRSATQTIAQIEQQLSQFADNAANQEQQNVTDLLTQVTNSIGLIDQELAQQSAGKRRTTRHRSKSRYMSRSRSNRKNKSRNNKKQRGGFIYKTNSKRRSISSR